MGTQPPQQPLTINSLPKEVLLDVFSFLRPVYLCETVSKVCTYWEELCDDPCLYKTKTLKFRGEVSTETVVKLLKVASSLESLILADMNEIGLDTILKEVCQHKYKICALVIKNVCKPVYIKQVYMNKIIQNCNSLHTLILHGCYVREKTFYKNLCIQLPHLKILHLMYEESLFSWAMVHLVDSCFDLEDLQITFADVTYMCVSSEYIVALCKRFYKTLRSFRLDCGDWNTKAFCELQKCDRLKTLGIWRAYLQPNEDLLIVSSFFNLRRLELTLYSRPDASTLILLFSSGGLANLESLELRTHRINDQVAAAIGNHLKKLQTLSLNGFHITDVILAAYLSSSGVESIIKGCVMLLELNLHFGGTPFFITEAIRLIPHHLPGLKKLLFSPCKDVIMDAEALNVVAQIKICMPNLQLELKAYR